MEYFKEKEMVEGYRVISHLGNGAASSIYLVQDPKSCQLWALKHVKKEEPKDQRFLDQAEAEYKAASTLDHPNIRKIERLIKSRQFLTVKELFLVMEFLDGVSVEQEPPRTMEKAIHIFHDVAEALAYMHDQGWVHADMKPNNVIVTGSDQVKIIDLGQSCRIGTVKERIQGTPDYIAPEQVHRRPITPRTDVYNLGATMYRVLAGRAIPTALAKGDSLVGSLDDHMIEKPQPVAEINPRVHPRLNDLVMQCLEVDAEKRPEDMHKVADRLNLILGIVRAEAERLKMASGSPILGKSGAPVQSRGASGAPIASASDPSDDLD